MRTIFTPLIVALVAFSINGVTADEGKCHKSLYNKCGEELGSLNDAIEEVSILDIIKGVAETASCIVQNMDSIVEGCTDEKDTVVVEDVEEETDDDESRCHKELYEECGDELKALKKAIKDTTPTGITGAALEVSGCITSNFVKLVKTCSPLKMDDHHKTHFKFGGMSAFHSGREHLSEMFKNHIHHHMSHHEEEEEKEKNSFMTATMAEGKASFMEEINGVHFDFNDCVEMARHSLVHEYGHSKFKRHGFFGLAILFVILAGSFAKGYHLGKKHHHPDHHHHHHHHHCFLKKICKFIRHLLCWWRHHDDDDDDDDNGGNDGPGKKVAKVIPEGVESEGKVQYVAVAEA